jgi:hypothetical protein
VRYSEPWGSSPATYPLGSEYLTLGLGTLHCFFCIITTVGDALLTVSLYCETTMKQLLPCLAVLTLLAVQAGSARAQTWGTIKGKITWGKQPVPPHAMLKLPEGNAGVPDCIKANNGKPPPDEEWVVNPKNKGIRDTFVWLVDAEKKPLPIHPNLKEIKVKQVAVDQPACHFIPHAIALREGQTLLVKNSASFAHNVKWTGNPDFAQNNGNVLIPAGGQFPITPAAQRLPIKIECNIHSWMNAWVGVFGHPYFAVTDEDGNFEFKDAPAGNFRLMIWHAREGWKDGAKGRNGDPVEIKAGVVTDLGNIQAFGN